MSWVVRRGGGKIAVCVIDVLTDSYWQTPLDIVTWNNVRATNAVNAEMRAISFFACIF